MNPSDQFIAARVQKSVARTALQQLLEIKRGRLTRDRFSGKYAVIRQPSQDHAAVFHSAIAANALMHITRGVVCTDKRRAVLKLHARRRGGTRLSG